MYEQCHRKQCPLYVARWKVSVWRSGWWLGSWLSCLRPEFTFCHRPAIIGRLLLNISTIFPLTLTKCFSCLTLKVPCGFFLHFLCYSPTCIVCVYCDVVSEHFTDTDTLKPFPYVDEKHNPGGIAFLSKCFCCGSLHINVIFGRRGRHSKKWPI